MVTDAIKELDAAAAAKTLEEFKAKGGVLTKAAQVIGV